MPQRDMVLKYKFIFSRNYDVILTVSLITQIFTLCQMMEFLYDIDIYDTNMEPSEIRNMTTHC